MVAWCQESNGSIPQSQLLQVRKTHKWICDTAKSGLAYIMNLCVTLTWLCDCQCSRMSILVHSNSFWTAYSCLVIAERPRYWSMEGIQVWRTHFPDGPLIFFIFFFPSCTEFLEFQQLSRDPGLPLFERDRPKVLEKALHVLAPFWAVLLY